MAGTATQYSKNARPHENKITTIRGQSFTEGYISLNLKVPYQAKVINTFDTKLHEYIHEVYGNTFRQHVYFPIGTMVTSDGMTIDPYSYAYCCCMFRSFYDKINLATKEDCQKMASMGVQPWAGASIEDEDGVDAVIDRGCTLITCNNPDEILDFLKKKGKHK